MSKIMKLTQGKYTIVDNADYESLNQHKWCAWKPKSGNIWYAVRNATKKESKDGSRGLILMHRVILDVPAGMQTDHKNHNGLDNQRHNIRPCTNAENQHNQRVTQNGTSRFKGVSWFKLLKKWQAHIRLDGKLRYLGCFTDETEAAIAYNRAAFVLFGKFACLNPIT